MQEKRVLARRLVRIQLFVLTYGWVFIYSIGGAIPNLPLVCGCSLKGKQASFKREIESSILSGRIFIQV